MAVNRTYSGHVRNKFDEGPSTIGNCYVRIYKLVGGQEIHIHSCAIDNTTGWYSSADHPVTEANITAGQW